MDMDSNIDCLKTLTEDIVKKQIDSLKSIERLCCTSDSVNSDISNLINTLQMVGNRQFAENRVQEDDSLTGGPLQQLLAQENSQEDLSLYSILSQAIQLLPRETPTLTGREIDDDEEEKKEGEGEEEKEEEEEVVHPDEDEDEKYNEGDKGNPKEGEDIGKSTEDSEQKNNDINNEDNQDNTNHNKTREDLEDRRDRIVNILKKYSLYDGDDDEDDDDE